MSIGNQEVYRNSGEKVRARFGTDAESALKHYNGLVRFITGVVPPEGRSLRLLDVGCGTGWSTYAFALAGYDSTGIDLNSDAFEPPPHDNCRLSQGSATEIPHPADTFDVVVCYACLEHVPDPLTALEEMTRVCRPGGVVAVVGPNLVSPLFGPFHLSKPSVWKTLRLRRRPGMPRHPYGNTVPELLGMSLVRGFQLLGKLVSPSPHFTIRDPDTKPPFHGDNDACYLCNPTDLIRFFRQQGCHIERRGKPGRVPLSHLVAGGTYVAARKPATRPGEPGHRT